MSKHTPGPWRIGPKLQGASFTIVNPNGDAEMGNWLVARAHWEQDARLIAAAPETAAERDKLKEVNAELLAALKRVDQSWTEWLPCGPYDESLTTGPTVRIYESTISIWKQIRAAITKATGGENV